MPADEYSVLYVREPSASIVYVVRLLPSVEEGERNYARVGEFLTYDSLFLSEDLTAVLDPQFRRLSDIEKTAIGALANAAPVSLSQLRSQTELSPSDLLKAMQSLSRRCLIEKQDSDNETVFSMQPIVQEYVKIKIRRSS